MWSHFFNFFLDKIKVFHIIHIKIKQEENIHGNTKYII